ALELHVSDVRDRHGLGHRLGPAQARVTPELRGRTGLAGEYERRDRVGGELELDVEVERLAHTELDDVLHDREQIPVAEEATVAVLVERPDLHRESAALIVRAAAQDRLDAELVVAEAERHALLLVDVDPAARELFHVDLAVR